MIRSTSKQDQITIVIKWSSCGIEAMYIVLVLGKSPFFSHFIAVSLKQTRFSAERERVNEGMRLYKLFSCLLANNHYYYYYY